MKLIITRVREASVTIDGVLHSAIGAGLLVLIGITEQDGEEQANYLAKKTAELRIFSDDAGKINRSCADIGGEILVVSNFTLCAETKKGNRPSFIRAARPERANALYEYYVNLLRASGYTVKTGVFGADMQLMSVNDGPVTIWMDTEAL